MMLFLRSTALPQSLLVDDSYDVVDACLVPSCRRLRAARDAKPPSRSHLPQRSRSRDARSQIRLRREIFFSHFYMIFDLMVMDMNRCLFKRRSVCRLIILTSMYREFLKKVLHKREEKCKKEWRWPSRKMKIWYKVNNIVVFIFAQKWFSNYDYFGWYGLLNV